MKLIDLYNIVNEKYPGKVNAGAFSDPSYQSSMGIQWVNEYGLNLPPPVLNPRSFILHQPFAGPFYQLDVFGCTIIFHSHVGKEKHVRFLVRDEENVYYSAILTLTMSIKALKELVAEIGIKWYSVNVKAFPNIEYTEFQSLEKLIIYERELELKNSSLQPD